MTSDKRQTASLFMRRLTWLVCLAVAGCQSVGDLAPQSTLTQLMPKAMRFAPLAEDPLLPLASQAFEHGDRARACDLLRLYVDRHPESRQARVFFAEVLTKLGKSVEATFEFEKAAAALQQDKTIDLAMLVHCHGRLLDLADDDRDEYHVHLYRGLGLYWLAQQKRRPEEAADAVPTEAILCKAALELGAAHAMLPEEARSSWYLHLCWRQLGQTAAAERWLHEARGCADFSYLTPREQYELQLASR